MGKIRIRSIAVLIVVLFLLLSACGSRGRMKAYDEDGMLGTTNVNPNLQTNPANTYRNDQELVKRTLAKFKNIRQPVVLFNGATIVVYYEVPDRYTARQAYRLENDLRKELQEMLPRYEIDLRRKNK